MCAKLLLQTIVKAILAAAGGQPTARASDGQI
jgi:hypothetical protein